MIKTPPKTLFVFEKEKNIFLCKGDWSILHLAFLTKQFKEASLPKSQKIVVSGAELSTFDSAGALALTLCVDALKAQGNEIELKEFNQQQLELLKLIHDKEETINFKPPAPMKKSVVYKIGEQTMIKLEQMSGLVNLIGDLVGTLFRAFSDWRRFQFPSIVSNINSAGITALPIIGLLSFLIGVVLAYQMGLQLEAYGANVFIAYLSGMAIFREFAPLITAIIVAGRTSSAFTAQIGSMKINEEIDALYTMGLSPTELLVVPKILGLVLIFPLLIFWADFFSTLGAMMMAKLMLNVGYSDFLAHLHDSVGASQLMLGLYKAPTFAILISLVGCFQGFRVQSNADSLGQQTTRSVVQSLFLIIIADAVYSIIYSSLGL